MARALEAQNDINDRRTTFVRNIIAGRHPTDAYKAAYPDAGESSAKDRAGRLMHDPAILAALHIGLAKQLQSDAVLARAVCVKILQDDSVAAKVRADLGVKMLRLAGHVEPRAAIADNGPVKTLSEMSTEELRARAAQLEDEIANRARPISSASAVPSAGQVIDIIE